MSSLTWWLACVCMLKKVKPLGLTMFPTRIRRRNFSLVRVIQVTPKTTQTVNVALAYHSEVEHLALRHKEPK